jgi:endonuclease I
MKIKLFKEFLVEKLIDVDKKDIDMVFAPLKRLYKDLQAVWKKHGVLSVEELEKQFKEVVSRHVVGGSVNHKVIKTFSSGQLSSAAAQQAHKINPIKIKVYAILPHGASNSYNMLTKEIVIGLPLSVWEAMAYRLNHIPHHQLAMLTNETSDIRLLSTIRHELTHWLDDSLHNQHLNKKFSRFNADLQKIKQADGDIVSTRNAVDASYKKHVTKGEEDIYLTPLEITPFVNQIQELKRRIGDKKYDKLTWADIMTYMPSLDGLNRRYGAKFRKLMFTRMARENLLTKNLRNKVDIY